MGGRKHAKSRFSAVNGTASLQDLCSLRNCLLPRLIWSDRRGAGGGLPAAADSPAGRLPLAPVNPGEMSVWEIAIDGQHGRIGGGKGEFRLLISRFLHFPFPPFTYTP